MHVLSAEVGPCAWPARRCRRSDQIRSCMRSLQLPTH
jgi:hypothetical protein